MATEASVTGIPVLACSQKPIFTLKALACQYCRIHKPVNGYAVILRVRFFFLSDANSHSVRPDRQERIFVGNIISNINRQTFRSKSFPHPQNRLSFVPQKRSCLQQHLAACQSEFVPLKPRLNDYPDYSRGFSAMLFFYAPKVNSNGEAFIFYMNIRDFRQLSYQYFFEASNRSFVYDAFSQQESPSVINLHAVIGSVYDIS